MSIPEDPRLTPEDVYGEEILCPECECTFYAGIAGAVECPDCGWNPADDFEPDYDDYDEVDYRADYPERYGLI